MRFAHTETHATHCSHGVILSLPHKGLSRGRDRVEGTLAPNRCLKSRSVTPLGARHSHPTRARMPTGNIAPDYVR